MNPQNIYHYLENRKKRSINNSGMDALMTWVTIFFMCVILYLYRCYVLFGIVIALGIVVLILDCMISLDQLRQCINNIYVFATLMLTFLTLSLKINNATALFSLFVVLFLFIVALFQLYVIFRRIKNNYYAQPAGNLSTTLIVFSSLGAVLGALLARVLHLMMDEAVYNFLILILMLVLSVFLTVVMTNEAIFVCLSIKYRTE